MFPIWYLVHLCQTKPKIWNFCMRGLLQCIKICIFIEQNRGWVSDSSAGKIFRVSLTDPIRILHISIFALHLTQKFELNRERERVRTQGPWGSETCQAHSWPDEDHCDRSHNTTPWCTHLLALFPCFSFQKNKTKYNKSPLSFFPPSIFILQINT